MKKQFFSGLLIAGLTTLCQQPVFAQTVTNTILNINYEDGTKNSGITGINPTNAPAADAAYMVQPGATGNWAIAHKIIEGDPNYFSDGNYRSEADAVAYLPARFNPGDERRYEVSILLKDWVAWNTGEPPVETNLFQLKLSDGNPVPLMIRTTRNALRLRYGNMDGTITTEDIIPDVRSYVNQWMHFRIDVKWTMDNTGYITTYMKLPGQTDYTQADQKLNRRTFTGDPAGGNVGYLKWGLYVAPAGVTRIAYHDDIRIFELNNASTPIALWNNPITDTNPAYQPDPYAPTNDVVAANVVNNSTSPSSDFSRTTLTSTGGSTLGGRYLLGGWANGTVGTPSPFDNTEYYEFKIAPETGYKLTFSSMSFYWRTGNASHPNTYVLRSSLDGFASDISAPVMVSDDAANTSNFGNTTTYNLAGLSTTGEVTFRLYWYGATASNGVVGIDNFAFNGTVFPISLPAVFSNVSASFLNGALHVNWLTATENHDGFYEIQASHDGKNFTTIETVKSKNDLQFTSRNYEAVVAHANMKGLLALPLVIALLSFAGTKKRWKLAGLAVFALVTIMGVSCSKNNESLQHSDQELYVRIKQVDADGKAVYSKVVKVAVN